VECGGEFHTLSLLIFFRAFEANFFKQIIPGIVLAFSILSVSGSLWGDRVLRIKIQLLTMDILALATMKNAAKCDT
jgi:hypothetical protein